jgi:hypothetical protein
MRRQRPQVLLIVRFFHLSSHLEYQYNAIPLWNNTDFAIAKNATNRLSAIRPATPLSRQFCFLTSSVRRQRPQVLLIVRFFHRSSHLEYQYNATPLQVSTTRPTRPFVWPTSGTTTPREHRHSTWNPSSSTKSTSSTRVNGSTSASLINFLHGVEPR